MSKFYVTMTDTFMSGWGQADNKINKFVVECDTLEQAETIKRAANERGEMKRVNIVSNKPNYSDKTHLTSLKKFDELGEIWTTA